MFNRLKDRRYFRQNAFFFCIAFSIVFAFVRSLMTGGLSNQWFFFYDTEDSFMDFFNSIYDASVKNPYTERGVIYPPLPYLFYAVFAKMIPPYYLRNFDSPGRLIRQYQYPIMYYFIYSVLILLVLIVLCHRLLSKSRLDKTSRILILIGLFCSCPILYALERGNLILITLICILLFLYWKNSPNPIKREAALIFLAIAFNTKLYPAVFGLLLLKEKRWGEAIRCAIYGIVLFIVPMFFFGGLSNIPVMFSNVFSTSGRFSNFFGSKLDLSNFFAYLGYQTNLEVFNILSGCAMIIGLVVLLFAFFTAKEYWKQVLTLSTLLIVVPGFSFMYSLVFLFPVILLYFTAEKHKKGDLLYLGCFILPLIYWPFNIFRIFPFLETGLNSDGQIEVTAWSCISSLALYFIMFLLLADGIRNLSRKRKKQV